CGRPFPGRGGAAGVLEDGGACGGPPPGWVAGPCMPWGGGGYLVVRLFVWWGGGWVIPVVAAGALGGGYVGGGGAFGWAAGGGGVSLEWPSAGMWMCQSVWWAVLWWAPQTRAVLVRVVGPASAQWVRWCTSHQSSAPLGTPATPHNRLWPRWQVLPGSCGAS